MTEQITNIPDKGNKKRIVIVGGGFGGLKIARKLKRQHYQVVLLDKNNYHPFPAVTLPSSHIRHRAQCYFIPIPQDIQRIQRLSYPHM